MTVAIQLGTHCYKGHFASFRAILRHGKLVKLKKKHGEVDIFARMYWTTLDVGWKLKEVGSTDFDKWAVKWKVKNPVGNYNYGRDNDKK